MVFLAAPTRISAAAPGHAPALHSRWSSASPTAPDVVARCRSRAATSSSRPTPSSARSVRHRHRLPVQRPAGPAEQVGRRRHRRPHACRRSRGRSSPAATASPVRRPSSRPWRPGDARPSPSDEFVTRGSVRPSQEDYTCSRGSLEDLPRDEFEDLPAARPRHDALARALAADRQLRGGRAGPDRGAGPGRGRPLPALRLRHAERLLAAPGSQRPPGRVRHAPARAPVRPAHPGPPLHRPRRQQVHLVRAVRRRLRRDRGTGRPGLPVPRGSADRRHAQRPAPRTDGLRLVRPVRPRLPVRRAGLRARARRRLHGHQRPGEGRRRLRRPGRRAAWSPSTSACPFDEASALTSPV